MSKAKNRFFLTCIAGIIVLLAIVNFARGQINDAYYQQTKITTQALENHVDSILYNLDVFFNSESEREAEAALQVIYLHAALLTENIDFLQRYCDSYYSVSAEALLKIENQYAAQRTTIRAFKIQLTSFQEFLLNICVIGLPEDKTQIYENLFTAKSAFEKIMDCLSENNLSAADSPKEIVNAFGGVMAGINSPLKR